MRSWVLALAVVACGDVNKVPDVVVPDAFQPDSSSAPACQGGETVCNGVTCANLMTDELNCGACNNICAPTQGCASGACVPLNATCARVREVDPAAQSGAYVNPQNGRTFYCDFEAGFTIDGLAMGQYTTVYAGYELVVPADLTNPALQTAFVAFMNQQGGLPTLSNWLSNNCCFSTTGGLDWKFGGTILYPANGATDRCNQNPTYSTPNYTWSLSGSNFATLPIPADYLATHAPTAEQVCSDGINPGFFWKKKMALD